MKLKYLPIICLILLMPYLAFGLDIDTDLNDAVDVAYGGTNSTTAADARTALGVDSANIAVDNITQVTARPITSLTSSNYKVFYSAGGGAPLELTLGADATYLRFNGATSAPTAEAIQAGDLPTAIDPDKIGTDSTANDKIEAANLNIQSLDITLTSAYILVGNGSNIATPVALSGGARMANTGALSPYAVTNVDADGGEVDAYCYGGTWFASGAGTLLLPAIAAGMQITVENHTDADVLIDPDGDEVLRLNGTALGAGVAITGTDLGDGCVLTYYSAGVWSAFCSGYE